MADVRTKLHPARSSGGLGRHIRLWMLVIGLVPLLVVFVYGYWASRNALITAGDEHLLSVAGARRAQIQVWLHERMTDLEVISRSQDCITLVRRSTPHQDHSAVCEYLGSFQTGARDYRVLALFDLDWNWVASHTGHDVHSEALVDDQLRNALKTNRTPVMSPAHTHQAMGVGLHIADVLREPGGPSVGYVVAVLDLTGTFAPILRDRAGLGETGRVYLADLEGDILVGGDAGEAPNRLDPRILKTVESSESGVLHLSRSSEPSRFVAFARVENPNWVVVADMTEGESLGLLRELRRGFLIAGLFTLAAVIVLSARTARRLSAPLSALSDAARRIARGHPQSRVPELKGREVEDVGRAFNEMLDSLDEINRQRVQAKTLAAVGELSSNMVHEIRNRLSSVKMNLQALGLKMSENATHRELATIALEQVQRTEETLTDLLGYARPVAPEWGPIVLRDLLDGIKIQFQAEASARDVSIKTEDQGPALVLHGDSKLIEQALTNLVRNALEASPPGGSIVLRAVRAPEGGWVDLEVEDSGPGFEGIPPDDLFRPFFTTKEKGAGLGLAHVRKIAEVHSGSVGARSGKQGGSVFRISLPLKGTR